MSRTIERRVNDFFWKGSAILFFFSKEGINLFSIRSMLIVTEKVARKNGRKKNEWSLQWAQEFPSMINLLLEKESYEKWSLCFSNVFDPNWNRFIIDTRPSWLWCATGEDDEMKKMKRKTSNKPASCILLALLDLHWTQLKVTTGVRSAASSFWTTIQISHQSFRHTRQSTQTISTVCLINNCIHATPSLQITFSSLNTRHHYYNFYISLCC